MKTINDILSDTCGPNLVGIWLERGHALYHGARNSPLLRYQRDRHDSIIADVRALYGFNRTVGNLLTSPDANMKLGKTERPTYGLTLQHYVTKLISGVTVNGCEWAGHCTKVCVLNNGSGRYDSVQRARKWRTHLLVHFPETFFVRMGYELARAVVRHGEINFRPNVNSDVSWELWLEALFSGEFLNRRVWSYGYTKNPAVLAGNGQLFPYYRVAFSHNENHALDYDDFLARGGSVAVVTNRKAGDDVAQWAMQHRVVDADIADDWMFESGVIGDLSAKGRARKLIGESGFVARLAAYTSNKPVLVTVS